MRIFCRSSLFATAVYFSITMWPMLLDMSRDECKRVLRCMELEAYSNLVSALRAQGELSKEKRKLLQDLAATLNISMERHRAEVRRAVNDEKLATIAEHIAGPNTATEWAIEGRRLVPLMPRLVPQTAFTTLANNAANIAAAENARLPPPSMTKRKNIPGDESPPREPNIPEASKTPQCSTSSSAVHLKKDEEDDISKKRRRSMSLDVAGVGQPLSPPTKVQSITSPQAVPARTVPFPVKITLSTALGRTTITTTSAASTTQKVIIVSGSTASGSPSMLQRSLSVPIVKTVSAGCSPTNTSQQSLIINTQPHGSSGNMFTISTSSGNSNTVTPTSVSIGGVPATAYITSPKIRPKAVQLPAKPRPRAGSIVIPMTPNQLSAGSSVQLKSKPSLHIKQDTGMKILPVSNVGSTAKILPKATSLTSTGQSPIYVMSSTTTGMSMVTRTVSSSTAVNPAGSNASGTTTVIGRNTTKPLQALHISTQSGNIIRPSGGKPNVIVVQKGAASGFKTLSHSGKEMVSKVIMSKSLTTPLNTMTVQKPIVQSGSLSNITSSQGNVIVLDLSQEQLSKNSVLAEILQASGIMTTQASHSFTSSEKGEAGADWVTVEAEKEACVPQPLDVPERVVTLEEAVELLGQTQFEENQTAAESGAGTNAKTEVGGEIMEVVGELDPQTGIYSLPGAVNSTQTVVKIVPRLSSTSRDIFSTALASADINLDTLQYIEDNMEELQGAEQQILSAEVNQDDSQDIEAEEQLSAFLQPGLSENTAVTVEPSNIDTTGMHIEDYASQKVQGNDIG